MQVVYIEQLGRVLVREVIAVILLKPAHFIHWSCTGARLLAHGWRVRPTNIISFSDILDEDGMIIAINTAQNAPSSFDPLHRFKLTTCYRLADGASGMVRSDTLVTNGSPQCVSQASPKL
jgi:hypothetical protein